jgi:hypothetical protein
MTTVFRQGDVLMRRTRKKPTTTAKAVTDRGRVILAYGEVTGHCHEVVPVTADPDLVPAMELFEEADGTRLLVVRREARVQHEDHGAIALAPATYEIIRQREYVAPELSRSVAD